MNLTKGDIIKNYNFGALLDEIIKQRDKEKQKFFEDLVNGNQQI